MAPLETFSIQQNLLNLIELISSYLASSLSDKKNHGHSQLYHMDVAS
jgi:hypothetical protein